MTAKPIDLITVSKNPYNAGTPLPVLLEDVTPLELVYVRNHFEVPQIDMDEWSLEVYDTGAKPFSFSYKDLQNFPQKSLTVTLECAGNGRKSMNPIPRGTAWDYGAISVAEYTGTPLHKVLEKLDILEDVVEVAFHGADYGEVEPNRVEKYVRSLPLEVAFNPDTLLAWEMNGQTLTPNHGFPLRLVVPNWYAMASVKWLNKIELLSVPFKGFFQNEHYVYLDEERTQQGKPVQQIRPRSLILSPGDGEKRDQGKIMLTGMAWSGNGKITQVEVSVDGGVSWSKAELETPKSNYGVQKWGFSWNLDSPGNYTLVCRAKDSAGHSQPEKQVWNRLGYGNNGPHSIAVTVE